MPKLPRQIPGKLRASSVELPDLDDGEGAWSRTDALAVIDSLRGTTVPVSDVAVFERAPWGYAPSDATWSGDRLPGEADTDYAQRTRSGAERFIKECKPDSEDVLFVITFPIFKDAA